MYRQVSYTLALLPLHNRREGQSEESMENCIDIRAFLLTQISPYRLIPNQNFELINWDQLCNRRENQSDEIDYARVNEKSSDRIKTQKFDGFYVLKHDVF